MSRPSAVVLALAGVLIGVLAAAADRLSTTPVGRALSAVPMHATINDAVAAASPGETILVCASD